VAGSFGDLASSDLGAAEPVEATGCHVDHSADRVTSDVAGGPAGATARSIEFGL
jgi:hypothetical protein